MAQPVFELIGRGVYSLTEASRLTRVPLRRIRRWTRGYWFLHRGKRQWSEPVVGTDLGPIGEVAILEFADLMEVRFLNAFRNQKIGWQAIRLAAARAKEVLQTAHPFSSHRFLTDGRTILAQIVDEAGDRHLLELVNNQWELERVVIGLLREGLHYEGKDQPQWWSPLGSDRRVVLHPARSFGAPIVTPGSVRTRMLYGAYMAEGSLEAAADWYSVAPEAVGDAVAFEEGLRGRAA